MVHRFVPERFSISLSRSGCLNYLHRLGFVLKRPKKRLVRADAGLRGKWVLRGQPALVDSSSPPWGEKASYYSAVSPETGAVEWMELEGNRNSGTSEAFLRQLRERRPGPLNVIWDNEPAHRGEALREYLRTPCLGLRLVNPPFSRGQALPDYSPDGGADEAVGLGWRGGHRKPVPGKQG